VPSPSSHDESPRSPAPVLSFGWWVRDQNGGLTLAQWPNPALAVWLTAVVFMSTGVLGSDRSAALTCVSQGALVVWALDELVRGASPIRRLVGGVVLVGQLVRLLA
jgi:hypothetical protein